MKSVNTMSSFKKHTFTTSLPSIALHDFTPNLAFLYYDVDALIPTKSSARRLASVSRTYTISGEQQSINQWLNHYVTAKQTNESNELSTRQSNNSAFNEFDSAQNLNGTTLEIITGKKPLRAPDCWLLTQQDRTLVKGGLKISLTSIESALIKKMLHHEERVVSKEELIRNIGREPEHYRGLEMCLSRLQDKFRRVNAGERLFRAVRNRGYCLTQKIKKPLEVAQQRR